MADLTTEFTAYIKTLKAAKPTALDVTTLITKDLPNVRAAHVTRTADCNTLYEIHL